MKQLISKLIPKNILITQLGNIRDCLLTIPLMVDIKRLWPDASVHWIVESGIRRVLESHRCVAEVQHIESGWIRRPKEWLRLRAQLRSKQFDLVFDPLGLMKSSALGALTGARVRVGFTSTRAREMSSSLNNLRITSVHRHRVDIYRELLKFWSEVEPGRGEYEMPVFEDAAIDVQDLLQAHDLNSSMNWFAIHPGALWPTARWPVDRFGTIARELHDRYGFRCLVIWSGQEEHLLSKVVVENSGGAAQLAPELGLTQMIELIRQSRFLLCADSEPLQLAASIGTPCISLHGPTWADEFGAYRSTQQAIQSPLANLSRRTVRRGPNLAMQAIEVDEVLFGVRRLLHRIHADSPPHLAAA